MKKLTSQQRLSMVLAVVPWLYEQGGATADEIGMQFDLPSEQVMEVLSAVQCCEIPPYGGATLGITVLDDGEVIVDPSVALERPLRLTADEAFGLVVATEAARALPGVDPDGALSRATQKLKAILGGAGGLEIELGDDPDLALLNRAMREQRSIDVSYYAAYRDEMTKRRIDPLRVYSRDGHWYLLGYCHEVQDRRTFRVDRFLEVELGEAASQLPDEATEAAEFVPDDAVQRVRLRLPMWAKTMLDQAPTEDGSEVEGMYEVTVAVTGEAWLEQLLLRVGSEAYVLEPPELRATAKSAAQRLLSRYN